MFQSSSKKILHAVVYILSALVLLVLIYALNDIYQKTRTLDSGKHANSEKQLVTSLLDLNTELASLPVLTQLDATSKLHLEMRLLEICQDIIKPYQTSLSNLPFRLTKEEPSISLFDNIRCQSPKAKGVNANAAEQNSGTIVTIFSEIQSLAKSASLNQVTFANAQRLALTTAMKTAAILLAGLLITLFIIAYSSRNKARLILRRELQLKESRQQLSDIITFAPDAVIVVNIKGEIREFNNAAASYFGYTKSEATGRNLWDLIAPTDALTSHNTSWQDALMQQIKGADQNHIELSGTHKNGTNFPIEMTFGTTKGLDEQSIVIFLRDISDQKTTNEALQQALKNAEAASATKANFLAIMSHEMRTPLVGIIGALDLLTISKFDEKQSKLLSTARNASHELLAQICDVLDFSKLEAHKVVLEPVPCSLHEIVKLVAEILSSYFPDHNNEIRFKIDDKINPFVEADEQRIKQVLLNLGSNALKFTHDGLVEFRVTKESSGNIRFSVSDTGIGISQENLGRLFKEFSMIDASLKRSTGGTGLGLAICARLVEAMKGQIGVQSTIGVGSTFWFSLPLQEASAKLIIQKASLEDTQQLSGVNVLVVEDNNTNQFIIREMLNDLGCKVSVARNGQEAVNVATKYGFDIIFMDVSMPVMDGLEATQIIRAQQGRSSCVPIIALTANATAGDREKFLANGFSAFLSKPVRKSELFQAMIKQLPNLTSKKIDMNILNTTIKIEADQLIDRGIYYALLRDLGEDIMPGIMVSMRHELTTLLDKLNDIALQEEPSAISKTAHAISGLAATVGAAKLSKLAKEMELSKTPFTSRELKDRITTMQNVYTSSFTALAKIV